MGAGLAPHSGGVETILIDCSPRGTNKHRGISPVPPPNLLEIITPHGCRVISSPRYQNDQCNEAHLLYAKLKTFITRHGCRGGHVAGRYRKRRGDNAFSRMSATQPLAISPPAMWPHPVILWRRILPDCFSWAQILQIP